MVNPKLIATVHPAEANCEGGQGDATGKPALHLYYHHESPEYSRLLKANTIILDDLNQPSDVVALSMLSNFDGKPESKVALLQASGVLRFGILTIR